MFFFFFNDTATTEIYTLSLHDALPILLQHESNHSLRIKVTRMNQIDLIFADKTDGIRQGEDTRGRDRLPTRSEEHTSELQSRLHLVCRLLLEKKKTDITTMASS